MDDQGRSGPRRERLHDFAFLGVAGVTAVAAAGALAPYGWIAVGGVGAALALLVGLRGALSLHDRSESAPLPLERADLARSTALAALEAGPDPVVVVDEDSRIRLVNAAARRFLGRDALDKKIASMFRSPAVLAASEAVLAGGASRAVDYTLLVPVERHLRAYVTPIDASADPDTPSEQRRAILITIHDLTSLRRAERTQADFVANASHELRTPLSSLTGFIETLRGHARDDADARERFLAIMQDQAARMRRLIDGLLSLSRIELYEHVPPSETADLAAAVRDAVDAALPIRGVRGAGIDVVVGENGPFVVVGDHDEVAQVVQNLVSNALKYGEGNPVEVTVGRGETQTQDLAEKGGGSLFVGDMASAGVRGRALEAYAFIRVRDHGPGISRENLPRLTERFYRVPERTTGADGSGLGLAIVKHIVNRHRGLMMIESAAGSGSAFTVFLPESARQDEQRIEAVESPVRAVS